MLERVGPRGIRHSHVNPKYDWRSLLRYKPLFIPLRHPLATALSWARKGRPVEDLPERWKMIRELDAIFIPIDAENRDDFLLQASKRCGEELDSKNWEVVGGSPKTSCIMLNDYGQSIVDRELQHDFWDRWYALAT